MKKILNVFIAFCLISFSCSFFDKDISCKAKLTLTIINVSKFERMIEISKYNESYMSDRVTILYKDSTSIILPHQNKIFIFNYEWIGNNECFFSDAFFESYRIDVKIKSTDSLELQYQVYPFDTTINMQNICTNCVHEYSDTLIIE